MHVLTMLLIGLLFLQCKSSVAEDSMVDLISNWSVLKEDPYQGIKHPFEKYHTEELISKKEWVQLENPNLTDQQKNSIYWFQATVPKTIFQESRDPALYIQLSKTAQVFVGNRLVATHGDIEALSMWQQYPGWRTIIYDFQQDDAGKPILIRMKSPSTNNGFHTTYIGSKGQIYLHLFRSEQLQFGFGTFFLVTSFVVLLLYLFAIREKSIFALALILFFSGLYHISATNTLAAVYVDIPYLWPFFFYSGIYFLPASIGLFIESSVLVKPGILTKVIRYTGVIYGMFSILFSAVGLINIESTLDIAHLIVILTTVIYLPVLIRNIVKKDSVSIVLTASLFLFAFIGILDLIISRITERTIYNLSHFGAFQLVVVIAGIIGHKYQLLVNTLNEQSRILEKEVQLRTESLNRSLDTIRKDLDLARGIQQKILPAQNEFFESCRVIHIYKPLMEVGGDLYDIFLFSKSKLRIFLADATGHGIQAALFTMAIKTEYEALKSTSRSPSELLERLNRYFYRKYYAVNGLFTAVVADIDLKNNLIVYSSAGHPDQLLFQENAIRSISKTGRMIGILPDAKYSESEYPFHAGDRLFLFSDGIIEASGKEQTEFSLERLTGIVSQQIQLHDIVDTVFNNIEDYSEGYENQDDRTFIAIENVLDSVKS